MDVRELKSYIYENKYIEHILESISCHHIKYHISGQYWSCANATGDNNGAVVVRDNKYLSCVNYTRQMIKTDRATDLIDLVCYTKDLTFPEALKFICEEIGISYYYDFEEDIPESFKILKLLDDMNTNLDIEKEKPLKPINKHILSYYKPYVNDLFYNDGIDYYTQREFEIGYDEESNRITIPIYSAINDLVGVKGRLFKQELNENDVKYLYLEQCNKSQILFGLNKTMPFIKKYDTVYVFEAEKAVLQCWSQGIKNTCATGGKQISKYQIDLLTRIGSKIVFCYDKDVSMHELEEISNRFIDGVHIYAMIDEDNILNDKESPSDNSMKFQRLIKNNVYMIR